MVCSSRLGKILIKRMDAQDGLRLNTRTQTCFLAMKPMLFVSQIFELDSSCKISFSLKENGCGFSFACCWFAKSRLGRYILLKG